MNNQFLVNFDRTVIAFVRKISAPLARCAIFLIYAWFGILKILGISPANPLVAELLGRIVPGVPPETFFIILGAAEILIGLLFLTPGAERVVIPIFILHMITTALPLFILPSVTWTGFLVPTLEGQYIIKNIALIALMIVIASRIRPWDKKVV